MKGKDCGEGSRLEAVVQVVSMRCARLCSLDMEAPGGCITALASSKCPRHSLGTLHSDVNKKVAANHANQGTLPSERKDNLCVRYYVDATRLSIYWDVNTCVVVSLHWGLQ